VVAKCVRFVEEAVDRCGCTRETAGSTGCGRCTQAPATGQNYTISPCLSQTCRHLAKLRFWIRKACRNASLRAAFECAFWPRRLGQAPAGRGTEPAWASQRRITLERQASASILFDCADDVRACLGQQKKRFDLNPAADWRRFGYRDGDLFARLIQALIARCDGSESAALRVWQVGGWGRAADGAHIEISAGQRLNFRSSLILTDCARRERAQKERCETCKMKPRLQSASKADQ